MVLINRSFHNDGQTVDILVLDGVISENTHLMSAHVYPGSENQPPVTYRDVCTWPGATITAIFGQNQDMVLATVENAVEKLLSDHLSATTSNNS